MKGEIMKRLLTVIMATLLFSIMNTGWSAASTQIDWTEQGSENLPCEFGGHWVLTGKGITSAAINVGDEIGSMEQRGKGSWFYDSTGPVTVDTVAYALYEGSAKNPQFVLSHCLEGTSPSPTPTPTTTSPTPTESPTPTDEPTPTPSVTTPEPSDTPVDNPDNQPPTSLPRTGGLNILALVAALAAVVTGGSLWYANRSNG